jgi:hypothetical protein
VRFERSAPHGLERLLAEAARVGGVLARVEDESLLHPRSELGIGRQLVERLRDDGATDDGLDLGREPSEVDGRSADLRDVRLRLRVLLTTQGCFLLVGEDRGFGTLRIQRLDCTLERSLVVVVVSRAVAGGQQLFDDFRLVPAEVVELRVCVRLLVWAAITSVLAKARSFLSWSTRACFSTLSSPRK